MTEFRKALEDAGLILQEFARVSRTPLPTCTKWYYGQRRTPGIVFEFLKIYIQITKIKLRGNP